jgi:hypothetical protein
MPAMSTVLDQAHNAIDRKLFAMKGFHHPGGSQAAFLTGLAHLYNLVPYQHRALNAGKCGGRSGRRSRPDIRLDAQPANPHFGRLSVCASTSPPLNSGECGILRVAGTGFLGTGDNVRHSRTPSLSRYQPPRTRGRRLPP